MNKIPETHDVAYPEWDDLTDAEKRDMIAQGHPLADQEDTTSSASSQHYIDTGRRMTNRETFEFEQLQRPATPDAEGDSWAPREYAERDFGDVFEDYAEAWQLQQNAAYVVVITLRQAIREGGLVVPDFVQTEVERFEKFERRASELGEIVRAHPTHRRNAEAVQIEGDN